MNKPTEILIDDLHEDDFMWDTGAVDPGFTIHPTVESQLDVEVTRDLTSYYWDFCDPNWQGKEGRYC